MADRAGGIFDQLDTIQDRLRQAPPADPVTPAVPASRWTLRTLREAVPALTGSSLSGIWRMLRRGGVAWRSARLQQFSPDPDYAAKYDRLLRCLTEAAADPTHREVLFLDEMGFTRWPDAGRVWGPSAPAPVPVASRQGATNGLWRLVGALNARTGQVDYRDNYIVGRHQLGKFYQQLDTAYPNATTISVVQDNWSIHRHPDVEAVVAELPRLRRIWLPTYAPWLNPIEKLWRWLRQTVLRQHRLAADWKALQARVREFLDQFGAGSDALLHYVGLHGKGALAQAISPP